MPTFCRHNRFLQNCPICAREQAATAPPPTARRARSGSGTAGASKRSAGRGGAAGVHVRRMRRGVDDGYDNRYLPGLQSSEDAERLAGDIAFGARRLALLGADPPGVFAEAAASADPGEAIWLCFLAVYLGPLDDAGDPWSGVRMAHEPWPALGGLADEDPPLGSRTAHDPRRPEATVAALRAWAERSGGLAAAFSGESAWTPARRFARLYERLSLPGLHRDARFDLLAVLGALGLIEVEADGLRLGGGDEVTVAAKRAFGIGDPRLLDRRAADLAAAAEMPLAALDVGLWRWEVGSETTLGIPAGDAEAADPDATRRVRSALGL